MEKMIAYCGLDCGTCPAYVAKQKNDDALRTKTAAEWSVMFKADIKAENINCDGCMSTGTLFHHCTVCEMRKCGLERKVNNCGACADFGCDKIVNFHKMVPDARKNLDEANKAVKARSGGKKSTKKK